MRIDSNVRISTFIMAIEKKMAIMDLGVKCCAWKCERVDYPKHSGKCRFVGGCVCRPALGCAVEMGHWYVLLFSG